MPRAARLPRGAPLWEAAARHRGTMRANEARSRGIVGQENAPDPEGAVGPGAGAARRSGQRAHPSEGDRKGADR